MDFRMNVVEKSSRRTLAYLSNVDEVQAYLLGKDVTKYQIFMENRPYMFLFDFEIAYSYNPNIATVNVMKTVLEHFIKCQLNVK